MKVLILFSQYFFVCEFNVAPVKSDLGFSFQVPIHQLGVAAPYYVQVREQVFS